MTAGASRILVVDDEATITELVTTALGYEGFDVAAAASGREALERAAAWRPDLIVLDVMLPDLDGFEVMRRLRAQRMDTSVVFLTARDATEDKIGGLTLGGDDYVTKPFSIGELVARVRAVLRRAGREAPGAARLAFADLEMDTDTREVWRAGRLIELTATEFNLLRYLMENARRVLSKTQILDQVWDYDLRGRDFGGDANLVETYISYLRKKVDASGPPLIHTLRGVGYSLRLPARQ